MSLTFSVFELYKHLTHYDSWSCFLYYSLTPTPIARPIPPPRLGTCWADFLVKVCEPSPAHSKPVYTHLVR